MQVLGRCLTNVDARVFVVWKREPWNIKYDPLSGSFVKLNYSDVRCLVNVDCNRVKHTHILSKSMLMYNINAACMMFGHEKQVVTPGNK